MLQTTDQPEPTEAKAERFISDGTLPCPEYACTLELGEHSPVGNDHTVNAEEGDVWHFDEIGRAGWPGPDGRFPDRKPQVAPAVEQQGFYGPYELRELEAQAQRQRAWVRPSWLMAVEDAQFECSMLGSPVPFSGDNRPTDRTPRLWDIFAPNRAQLQRAELDLPEAEKAPSYSPAKAS